MTTRLVATAKRHSATFGACAFAVAWFFRLGFGPTLEPTHIEWMLRNDWSAYLWGFSFFRNSDWAFPLGNTPELFYPFGTSVGFTDANPWVSLLAKPFAPWLPLDFQFCGMWFLLCFVLQAVFGTKITATMTDDKVRQALGGALFALTPLLPSRVAHVALSGFFFVTAGVYLHVRRLSSRAEAVSLFNMAICLLVWAAGTHGYLSVMLLVLVLAWLLRLCTTDALIAYREAALFSFGAVGVSLLTYWLFGYIGWKPADLTEEGFGDFSGDLTALINPQGWSHFFSGLPYRPRQWEGFLYLGTGVFLLLLLGIGLSMRIRAVQLREAAKRHWMFVATLLLLWLYSLSSQVAYQGETVLRLDGLYQPISYLTGIFRSSGRFAWPLHIALIAAGVAAASSIRRAFVGRLALLIAIVLQACELNETRLNFSDVPFRPLADSAWESAGHDYRHLRLLPVQILWVCKYDHSMVNRLSYEAYRRKLTFNSGNFMRKEPGTRTLCNDYLRPEDPVRADTVYVVNRRSLRDFANRNATCGAVDGLTVCVSNERESKLRETLLQHPVSF